MARTVIFFAACLSVWIAWFGTVRAEDAADKPWVVDCGKDKVVIFEDLDSKDGRFAVGWTIRTSNEKAKPVDWLLLSKEGAREMVFRYVYTEEQNLPYDFLELVVDLKAKRILELPSDTPYTPGKPRGFLGAYWGPATANARFGLVQNESRFATENLWLVRIDKSGMSQMELAPRLNKVVRKLLEDKMPLTSKTYAISYPGSDWDDGRVAPVFHASSVDIAFIADLPKSSFDQVTGSITVKLPEGTVLKVACDTRRDDPFRDDPKLVKADHELNQVYAELQRQLDVGKRAALKKEQLEWIRHRDSVVADDYPIAGMEVEPSAFRRERNNRLREATQERTAELGKRLKSKAQ